MRLTSRRSLVFLLGALLLLPAAVPSVAQDDSFPETVGEAMRQYEEDFEPENWAKGPVEYILLDYEREIWNDLEDDAQRRQFIAWFWNRRDLDPRDEKQEFKTAFYGRVAHANQRFHGFPRGWRSDRGKVWITIGRPNGGLRRLTDLRGYGRCAAQSGEAWTYYTNNMPFQSSFGEFRVIFVETRIGQYEICDPTMLGPGGMPVNLRRALEIMNESAVVDTVTEFEPGRDTGRTTVAYRDTVATVEPLTVPSATWGLSGVAGGLLVPVELPLRGLFFEAEGDALRATLQVEVTLVGMGAVEGRSGVRDWTLELTADDAGSIGGAALRSALLLEAEPGAYSVQVRVTDPISSTAWTWESPVEIEAAGRAVSPPLVGRTLARMRDGGEVGVIATEPARLEQGGEFYTVVWLRGIVPAAEAVTMTVVDAAGNEVVLTDTRASWASGGDSGPLILQATAPQAVPGDYVLRVVVSPDEAPVETRITIQ